MKWLLILFVFLRIPTLWAQAGDSVLLTEMQAYEFNALATFQEYRWLYYTEKQRAQELLAYEDLLGAYISRLRQAYETMRLLNAAGVTSARDIVARAYIYRALTFLEKAPIDQNYFESACYDYYAALELYELDEEVPAIYKPLPIKIQSGQKIYGRLVDMLQEKGKDLFEFGQVQLNLINFKVTTQFDPESLQLVRTGQSADGSLYTYHVAETRLQQGFRQALQQNRPVILSIALPAGTYYIRSRKNTPLDYVNLTTIYVRANEFLVYNVEPMADWIIFYEALDQRPSMRSPAAYAKKDDGMNFATGAVVDSVTAGARIYASKAVAVTNTNRAITTSPSFPDRESIRDRIENTLDKMPVKELEMLPIIRSRKEFAETLAEFILQHASDANLSSWNSWTKAWQIAAMATNYFSSQAEVATPLISLVHQILLQVSAM